MKNLLIIFSFLVWSLTACSSDTTDIATGTDNATQSNGEKMAANTTNPKVKIETTLGDIVLELDAQNAPVSTQNFMTYVKAGHYDGTIFHRVIPNFMIQGGGMNPDMSEKETRAPIKNEANNSLKNERGTVAMARTNDPHSATSQFFINVKDNGFLNFTREDMQGWGYAVFGKVVEGMDVVDKIEAVKTGNKGYHQDVPQEPVIMKKVTVIEE